METTFTGTTHIDPPADDRKCIIELKDVRKSFGDNEVLKGISLKVFDNTSSVIMGGSGSGKSVLIRSIVQLIQVDSGEIWVKGIRADTLENPELNELRLQIGFLFQGGALFDSMTIFDNMNFILERHSEFSEAERRDRIVETLSWVDIADKVDQFPSELSGGQQKRAALARALVLGPDIMIYDEPTTGLDPVSVRTVSDLIVRLRDEQKITSLTITHDLVCAEIISDDVHFLYDGQIRESGPYEQLRQSEIPELRNFFGA